MPTYKPYTELTTLPLNSKGERTILEAHLDQNLSSFADALEVLIQGLFAAGGVVVAGTVTLTGTQCRVQGHYGISQDARVPLLCVDQTVDLSSVTEGNKARIFLDAQAGETVGVAFTDADTLENITHTLGLYLGRLTFLEGDNVTHPALPPDAVPVAKVTMSGGVLVLDEAETTAPTPAAPFAGGGGGVPYRPLLQKSANYTVTAGDHGATIEVSATATITFPAGLPSNFEVVVVNTGTGTVTLAGDTGVTLSGVGTQLTAQWKAATVYHQGSDVLIVLGGAV